MNRLYNDYNIKWRVAIYARLSKEDEKNNLSESIENQIKFLKAIVNEQKWTLINTYFDDGYTGTNFERPGFQKVLKDIESGLVNLVITKDLSRLGRDHIGVGMYVEKYFPTKMVRYIAVNDNIDTFDQYNSNNDMTPFKSVINDMYAKDISNKVRSAIETKAKCGDCIKAFLPYGYKKDNNNKNKIIVDENVSENVKMIFRLYKKGKSKTQIANIFNDMGITTPLKYKEETTNYFNPNCKKHTTYQWNSTVINKILRDRIYAGDLVQLKNKKINYKIKRTSKVPTENQIIVLDNHKAIIERADFDIVQEMLNKQTNEWNYSNKEKHLLTGLVFCKCGSRITYNKNHGKNFRCICSRYKKYGNKFCSNVHIREDELIRLVTEAIKSNIKKYLNIEQLDYNKARIKKDNKKSELIKLTKRIEKLNKIISNLYEDKISEVISNDTFNVLVKKYEKQKKEYERKMEIYKQECDKTDKKIIIGNNEFKENMKKIMSFNEINDASKSLLFKLIDKIIIDDRNINIKYKFNICS